MVRRQGPLQGMRVVEVATFIAGPFAGQMLADLGADVIKVEPPGGDPFRGLKPEGYGSTWVAYNRNKRSIIVDQRDSGSPAIMRALIDRADVFLENARPGVWERLGYGYEQVRAWKPEIVYCSVSGFGQTGPWAQRPAFDGVGQGMSGLASQLMEVGGAGVVGPAFSDCITAMTAATTILAAYVHRLATGEGQHIDLSMLAATAGLLNTEFSAYFQDHEVYGPRNRARQSQSLAFTCGDGKMITAHISAVDRFWEALARAAGRPELLDDPRFSIRPVRIKNFDALQSALQEVFATKPRAEWLTILEEADVPHAPVLAIDEVLESPQARHLGLDLRLQHETQGEVGVIAPPARFSATPWGNLQAPPTAGQHTDEILTELFP